MEYLSHKRILLNPPKQYVMRENRIPTYLLAYLRVPGTRKIGTRYPHRVPGEYPQIFVPHDVIFWRIRGHLSHTRIAVKSANHFASNPVYFAGVQIVKWPFLDTILFPLPPAVDCVAETFIYFIRQAWHASSMMPNRHSTPHIFLPPLQACSQTSNIRSSSKSGGDLSVDFVFPNISSPRSFRN